MGKIPSAAPPKIEPLKPIPPSKYDLPTPNDLKPIITWLKDKVFTDFPEFEEVDDDYSENFEDSVVEDVKF